LKVSLAAYQKILILQMFTLDENCCQERSSSTREKVESHAEQLAKANDGDYGISMEYDGECIVLSENKKL
jgi:hypothetical protein